MSEERREKICARCGRLFGWRRKWARDWAEVRYCSAACRGAGVGARDEALERAILELLAERPGGGSICPSEAARRVAPEGWRPLLEATRRAARRLASRGRVEVVQRGRPVDPFRCRGPIRLRLPRS